MGTRVECQACNKVMIVREGSEMPRFCPRCGCGMEQGASGQGGSVPERVGCLECGRVLDASQQTAGAEVACSCGAQLRIPASQSARENVRKRSGLADARYEVVTSDDERHGPVAPGVLERWAVERRLLPEDQIRRISPDGSPGPLLRASEHPDLAGLFDQVPSREEIPGTPEYKVGRWLRRIALSSLGVAAAVVVRRATSSVGRATSRATQQPTPVIPDAPAVSDTVPTLPEAPADELPALVDQRIQDLSELPDVSASAPVEAADIPEQIADLTDQGQSRLGPSDTESVSPEATTPEQPTIDGTEVGEPTEVGATDSQQFAEAAPTSEPDLPAPPEHTPGPHPGPEEPTASLSGRSSDGRPVDNLSPAPEPPLRPPPGNAWPDALLPPTPPASADTGQPLHIGLDDLEPPDVPGGRPPAQEPLSFSENELEQARMETEGTSVADTRPGPSSRQPRGQTYQADDGGFDVNPDRPPVRQTRPTGTAAAGPTGSTAAAGGGLSALAKLLKLLMMIIFTGSAITAGVYAVKHFGLLGDSPSAVVKRYYSRLETGEKVSDLLSSKSRELYSEMGVDDPDTQLWITAVGRIHARRSTWNVSSEKIDGDRAWVMVVMETDDPVRTRIETLEAEISAKNAYNRRHGKDNLIAMNNAYLAKQKRMLASPLGRQMAEQLRRIEMPVLCVREGGGWKVAPAEQMDAAFENIGKMFDKMFENTDK